MKINVKVNNSFYKVEINDLDTLPVIARIGDEVFEVWPEIDEPKLKQGPMQKIRKFQGMEKGTKDRILTAPLPGIITELFIKPGVEITKGTPLLVIEAMKMKNKIHSSRSGTISLIHVKVGETVKHNQALLEFVD